jgi:hypothetical protein
MTLKPRAKQILLDLLSNYERLYVENYALKAMLSTSNSQGIRDTWEATLQSVLKQPEVEASLAELHAKFDLLRAQVSTAIDEEVGFGILLGMPTNRKPF